MEGLGSIDRERGGDYDWARTPKMTTLNSLVLTVFYPSILWWPGEERGDMIVLAATI